MGDPQRAPDGPSHPDHFPPEEEDFNPSYVTPRNDVLALIPETARCVLDLGCSSGELGAALKERQGARVIGLEADPALAAVARKRLDLVYQVDLERADLDDLLSGETFDGLVLADILEHLTDPWRLLGAAVACLDPDGWVLTSLPNVRHISTLYQLGLRGEWPLRDRGIHDRTHLRFFTRRGIIALLEGAGLEVREERRNLRIVERIHTINRFARWLDFPPLRPFFTFQYLHLARRRDP